MRCRFSAYQTGVNRRIPSMIEHIWISDTDLASSFRRWITSSNTPARCKRHASALAESTLPRRCTRPAKGRMSRVVTSSTIAGSHVDGAARLDELVPPRTDAECDLQHELRAAHRVASQCMATVNSGCSVGCTYSCIARFHSGVTIGVSTCALYGHQESSGPPTICRLPKRP